MIKLLKSNKLIILSLLIVCILFIINPALCANSCLNGISVWALNVLPVLFPFFIITKIIVNLSDNKPNPMDKFFNKLYNAPNGSFSTFFLATLSGYPMGAKLICEMYNNKQIDSENAQKMLSFCSVSGPMFMVGTVGVIMLKNYTAGIIILISNVIASLINGLLYKGKKTTHIYNTTSRIKSFSLADCVYDSLISILMVGAYIVLSFITIDLLENLHVIQFLSNTICSVFRFKLRPNIVSSVIKGFLEITRGILDLSNASVNIVIKTIISSGLIGFGGISIMLQSINFISHLKIPIKVIIIQKITQGLIACLISIPLSILFL